MNGFPSEYTLTYSHMLKEDPSMRNQVIVGDINCNYTWHRDLIALVAKRSSWNFLGAVNDHVYCAQPFVLIPKQSRFGLAPGEKRVALLRKLRAALLEELHLAPRVRWPNLLELGKDGCHILIYTRSDSCSRRLLNAHLLATRLRDTTCPSVQVMDHMPHSIRDQVCCVLWLSGPVKFMSVLV